ncbi:P22 phage major capsid protein family protein [Metabacillus sp. 22489]|uniref:P22 phage major capsid protein family protein n=1 Tax=Metabacillus sp. 22489 TaxID=3453928 RepID=UPI003F82B1F4
MSNQLITPQIVAKESLMVLENNMVFGNLVHRDYSNEFVSGVGDTVNVRKPSTFEAKEFSDSIEIQDAKEGSVPVKLDTHLDVSFEVTAKELTLDISEFSEQFVQPAMRAIAQKVDEKIAKLYKDIPFYYGIAGQTPATPNVIPQVRAILNKNKVPLANRNLVLNPDTEASFLSNDIFTNADKVGDNGTALREGSLGRKFGFNIYMDQNIQDHTVGTLAATGGDIVVKGAVAAGSSSLTLATTGSAMTGTLVKGDLLVINGKGYAVAQDTVASGNEIAVTLTIPTFESIEDQAVVGVTASHAANLAFHKNAFAFVTRPLALPRGNSNAAILNYNGLGIRVVQSYDVNTKKDIISLDLLGGFKTLSPEMAVRLIG